ncbi:ABC transporter substrate-binding protein [Collinsella tanakaei]|uniref:ABC transporter substrate-binding protein n=1 Tax=Collinsella tanakaei TaxID=626935 RepID=UPI00195BB389|nr:ABC transporter substrate-binding protein [Collinsella tanakaei]MBM6777954.1 ABC transporter substrate-binding protein [Collinsella tanakaei]
MLFDRFSPHRIPVPRRLAVAATLGCALILSACTTSATDNGSPAIADGSAPVHQAGKTSEEPTFRNADTGADLEHVAQLPLEYAQNFTVDEYEGGYQLVCISNGERFLVVPEGASIPENLADDIAVIQQPLESVYLVSTGMICLIDEIDALDAVTVSSVTAQESPNDNLTAALDAGDIAYGGKYRSPDFELIATEGCELAIENTKINHVPETKQKLQDLGCTVLTEQSSSEPEVLGRLEWIKLMGILFGREDEAQERFDEIAARVEQVASMKATGKTVAFFYINEDGSAVTRRSTDYFSQMVEMAGGSFVSFDPSDESEGSSSVQAVIDLETFYAQAKDADVIIYNTTVDGTMASIADLTGKNPLLADFKAVQDGEVYACDENMYQAMTDMDDIMGDIRCALTGTEESSGYIWKLS